MTSKNLFFKRMKQDLEQRIWLPVVFFILGFLFTEIAMISRLDSLQRLENSERIHNYLLNNFFTPGNAFIVLTIGMAVLSGLSGFAYMHSAKKLDVYHSIPVKRETLFLQQYIYGILYFLIPTIIHVLICLGISLTSSGFAIDVVGQAFGFVFIQLLIYLVVYSLVIMAVCLTGNLVVSVLGSGVLSIYSVVLGLLQSLLLNTFFVTHYSADSDFSGIPAFTPVHLIFNMILEMDNTSDNFIYTSYMTHYVKILFAIIVYTVIALFLYKKRPTEVAGKAMAFSITEPIVKTMIVIPVSIVSGYFFSAILSYINNFGWFVFGCLFGFAIICPLMEVIFRKDIKAVFSHPLQIAFNGVCIIVTLIVVRFDVLGYDTYIPNERMVESYAISFNEIRNIYMPYYMTYSNFIQYRFENMTITDNESARKLLEHAVEITRPVRTDNMYTAEGDFSLSDITVKYNLKNGKSVYRNYLINLADEQVMQWLSEVYSDIEFKKGNYPILAENTNKDYIGLILEYTYASEQLPLSAEKMQRFVETYQKELQALTFEEIFTEYPVAELSFAIATSDDEVTFTVTNETLSGDSFNLEYYSHESNYKIYDSFTQTLALLEEYGADIANEIPVEDVISISVNDYSREVNDHDGLLTKEINLEYTAEKGQQEEISQILPNLVSHHLSGDFSSYRITEPYMDIQVIYYYDNKEMSKSFAIRQGTVPEFLAEDIEEAAK